MVVAVVAAVAVAVVVVVAAVLYQLVVGSGGVDAAASETLTINFFL